MNGFSVEMMRAVNESPYDGVAVRLTDAYDVNYYEEKNFEPAVKLLKENSRKHIWPWIFWNRLVGFVPHPDAGDIDHRGNKPPFTKIKGMDIYNEFNALDGFINQYENALRIARKLNSPGIIIDLEAYNIMPVPDITNVRYNIKILAAKQSKSSDEIKRRLKEIGAQLSDIAAVEYPDATIWFFFTGLGTQLFTEYFPPKKDYSSISYLVIGMLEQAKKRNLKLKFISGGEMSLGYCYKSLDDLKNRITKRDVRFKPVLSEFSNLFLGATIAPWHKKEINSDWLKKKDSCRESELETIMDFEPLLEHLMKSYNYVWIYAATAASYNPYRKEIANIYNPIIMNSKEKATRDVMSK